MTSVTSQKIRFWRPFGLAMLGMGKWERDVNVNAAQGQCLRELQWECELEANVQKLNIRDSLLKLVI